MAFDTFDYLSIGAGSDLSALVNFEIFISKPPSLREGGLIPLAPPVKFRGGDSIARYTGKRQLHLVWNSIDWQDRVALESALFGAAYPTTSHSTNIVYSGIDEHGFYTPVTAVADRPIIGSTAQQVGKSVFRLDLLLFDVRIQAVIKDEDSALTASERLVLVDSTTDDCVISLLPISQYGRCTIVSVVKMASANTVTIAPDGSETIGGASTLDLTAQYHRVDLANDGTSKWKILRSRVVA